MEIELAEWGASWGMELTDRQIQHLARSKTLTVKPSIDVPGTWVVGATQHVGLTHVGELGVRIRPKVAVRRLVELLVRSVDRIAWSELDASWAESDDLVSSIAGSFVTAAERALRDGILQGYRTEADDLYTVRGRIDMGRQVSRGFGVPLPVSVIYDEYTIDVLENQLLAGAGRLLQRLVALPNSLQRRLQRLDHQLLGVVPTRPTEDPPSVTYTRLNRRYRTAVTLARIILASGMLEFEGRGSAPAPVFLVDMNKVFEDVVGLGIRDALSPTFHVDLQREEALDSARSIRFRPDIVVRHGGRPVAVADVKYKRASRVAAVDDIYQAISYAVRFGLTDCVLIYPEQASVEFLQVENVRIWLTSIDLDNSREELTGAINLLARRLVSKTTSAAR